MRWLFVAPLRRFVLLAAGASLLLNLAMLMPSLFTLQVFDRVFASRSIETLVMLSAVTLLALGFAYCMDVVRSRALASAGRTLHRLLSSAALEQALFRAATGGRADSDRLRDVTQLRSFLGSSGVRALFDGPWLPIYLFVIALMHPLLAFVAASGAVILALLAMLTERLTRDATDATLRRSRRVGRHAESLTRQAEVLVGMGMVAHAIRCWRNSHDELLDEQIRLGATAARLSALARIARQGVQIAVLGIGAWLVIDSGASPGIMIAATILLGRALQPVEHNRHIARIGRLRHRHVLNRKLPTHLRPDRPVPRLNVARVHHRHLAMIHHRRRNLRPARAIRALRHRRHRERIGTRQPLRRRLAIKCFRPHRPPPALVHQAIVRGAVFREFIEGHHFCRRFRRRQRLRPGWRFAPDHQLAARNGVREQ